MADEVIHISMGLTQMDEDAKQRTLQLMRMVVENRSESMWIGLLEVSPQQDAEVLRDVSGAFVNVVTWASNEVQFLEKAKIVMDKLKMAILGVKGAEPIANAACSKMKRFWTSSPA